MPRSTAFGSSASRRCPRAARARRTCRRPARSSGSPRACGARARRASRRAAPCSGRGWSARARRKPSWITSCTMRWLKLGVCRSAACLACSSLGNSASARRRSRGAGPAPAPWRRSRGRPRPRASARPAAPAARRRTRDRRTGCPRPSAGRPARGGDDGARGAAAPMQRPARVLEVRQHVEEARAAAPPSASGSGPRRRRQPDEARLVRREGLQRAEVGRRLDRDAAAGVDQHLADQVEALLRAGGDQHLRRRRRRRPCAPARRRPIRAAGRSLRSRRTAALRADGRAARARRASRIASTGKVSGEGRPPASEMMPGRSVTFRISRMIDGFIRSARRARVQAFIGTRTR